MKSLHAVILALTLLPGAALAADEKVKAEAPKPDRQMGEFSKSLAGKWRCTGKMAPPMALGGSGTAAAGAQPVAAMLDNQATIDLKEELGGFWLVGDYRVDKTKTTPEFRRLLHTGYDAGKKDFSLMQVDSLGGVSAMTSQGMQGNKIVFLGEGTVQGKVVAKSRTTLTKTSDNGLAVLTEIDSGNGFAPIFDDACNK